MTNKQRQMVAEIVTALNNAKAELHRRLDEMDARIRALEDARSDGLWNPVPLGAQVIDLKAIREHLSLAGKHDVRRGRFNMTTAMGGTAVDHSELADAIIGDAHALLAEVERLRAENERARELVAWMHGFDWAYPDEEERKMLDEEVQAVLGSDPK